MEGRREIVFWMGFVVGIAAAIIAEVLGLILFAWYLDRKNEKMK